MDALQEFKELASQVASIEEDGWDVDGNLEAFEELKQFWYEQLTAEERVLADRYEENLYW